MHQLVAHAFLDLPEIEKYVINHKNGNKLDNTSENLEFISNGENVKHAARLGLRKPYTCSVDQYDMNETLLNTYSSIKEAWEATGVSDSKISTVCKGKRNNAGGFIWKYTNREAPPNIDIKDKTYVRKLQDYKNYYVTNDGKIYSKSHNVFMSQRKDGNGYMLITLYQNATSKDELVHRLVAKTFIPNPEESPYVNHKNGNKSDNRVDNLDWMTCSENVIHANKLRNN